MNAKRGFVASLLLVLSLALTACGIMSVSTEDGELTISVNVSETQANRIVSNAIGGDKEDDFLFDDVTSVDLMEPNVIRIFGTTADGVSGSYDMTIGVVDEAIRLEVVAVDVPGITLDDPRVQSANDELAKAFLDSARTDNEAGGVTEVAVVGDELVFTIKAPLN